MITIRTKIDEKSQNALSRNVIIFCIVCLVVGSIGLLAYIVLSTINENPYLDFILLFSIPFALGLVYLISIKRNIKNMSAKNLTNEYTFNDDHFTIATIQNEEVVGTQKVYYKNLAKIKETGEYIFIYINQVSAFIVQKASTSEENIKLIRALLKQSLQTKKQ